MKKSQKQLLSVLFHLSVLGCMVIVFDAGKALLVKMNLIGKDSPAEKTDSAKKSPSDKSVKSGEVKKPSGGTTMADLMAQKAAQKKAEEQKKNP